MHYENAQNHVNSLLEAIAQLEAYKGTSGGKDEIENQVAILNQIVSQYTVTEAED